MLKVGNKANSVTKLIKQINKIYKLTIPQTNYYTPELGYYVLLFQMESKLEPDGIVGRKTWKALLSKGKRTRYGILTAEGKIKEKYCCPWYSNKKMEQEWGEVGRESNFERFRLPYPMKLAWDKRTKITAITFHKKKGLDLMLALQSCLDHYGQDKITELGLDLFGGSLNVRKVRGGKSWSSHAWATAIDIDPSGNPFRANPKSTAVVKLEAQFFCDQMVEKGFKTLEHDLMHWQAVI